MSNRLQISIENHVAEVMLNRPEKHNAVDMRMFDELAGAGKDLAAQRSVRAVVLTGAGVNFCAGIDVSIFNDPGDAIDPASMAPQADSDANRFQRAAYAWREIPVPVVCAIRGVAFGAGAQIALGADLRYARPDARLSIMEVKWGLIPDMAISTTLRHVMPVDRIKELAWTGRIVDGTEAERLGLVTAVHEDPAQAANAMATQIAGRSPDAIRGMKRLFNEGWNLSEAKSLALEAEIQLEVANSENQAEAVRANFEKRAPNFRDPD